MKKIVVICLLCLGMTLPKHSFGLIKVAVNTPVYPTYTGLLKSEGFGQRNSPGIKGVWGIGGNIYLSSSLLGLGFLPIDLVFRVSHNAFALKNNQTGFGEVKIDASTQAFLVGASIDLLIVHVAAAIGAAISNISTDNKAVRYKIDTPVVWYLEAGINLLPFIDLIVSLEGLNRGVFTVFSPNKRRLKSNLDSLMFGVGLRVGI